MIDVCAAPGGKALHIAEKLYVKEEQRKEQYQEKCKEQCKEKVPAGDAVMGESASSDG